MSKSFGPNVAELTCALTHESLFIINSYKKGKKGLHGKRVTVKKEKGQNTERRNSYLTAV